MSIHRYNGYEIGERLYPPRQASAAAIAGLAAAQNVALRETMAGYLADRLPEGEEIPAELVAPPIEDVEESRGTHAVGPSSASAGRAGSSSERGHNRV